MSCPSSFQTTMAGGVDGDVRQDTFRFSPIDARQVFLLDNHSTITGNEVRRGCSEFANVS